MHSSALKTGELFFRTRAGRGFRRILDIGGRDVNGSLRAFAPADATYISSDLEVGRGVDLVLADPYRYPFETGYFDCIVSTSCFEHDRLFWLTFLEAARVLSPTGLLYVNVPSQGAYHGYPYDNWRFYPDASLAIVDWTQRSGTPLYLVESFVHPDLPFNDYTMVFSKDPAEPAGPLLHETVPGAFNIRVGGRADIINPKLETPSIALVVMFGQEIQRLRDEVARLTALITPPGLAPDGTVLHQAA